MELKHQTIKKDGKNEFVVIPYKDFLIIRNMLEDYEDLIDLRKAKSESVNEPSISFSEVEKMIEDKS
jgi:hypothetical protein